MPNRKVSLEQTVAVPGHYWAHPIDIPNIAAAAKGRQDIQVPIPVELMSARAFLSTAENGDEIIAKAVIGQIGTLNADAAQDATTIDVIAPKGVLAKTKDNGVLDLGYFVSLGTEDFDPATDLAEYMVTAIGAPTPAGANEIVTVTISPGLASAKTAGLNVNLVVRFMRDWLKVYASQNVSFGDDTLSGSYVSANKRIRIEYRNNGTVTKSIYGYLSMLY